jgi:hypothetical protein
MNIIIDLSPFLPKYYSFTAVSNDFYYDFVVVDLYKEQKEENIFRRQRKINGSLLSNEY